MKKTSNNKISLKERYGKPLKFLWIYIKEYKSTFIFVIISSIILSLFTAGITIGNYYFLKFITEHIDSKAQAPEHSATIVKFMSGLLVALFLALVIYVLQTVFMTKTAQYTSKSLRKDLYFKILDLKLQYFDSTPSGDIMSRLTNDINTITMALTQNVTQFLVSSTQIFFFLIVLLLFSPIMGAIAIVFVPIQLSVVYLLFKKAQPNYAKKQVVLGDLNGYAEETISGQKIINNFNKQHLAIASFNKKNENLKNISYKSDLLSSLSNPWNTLMGNVLIGVMYIVAMALSINEINFGGIQSTLGNDPFITATLTMSLLTAMMTFTKNFSNPIYQIFQLLTLLQSAIAGTNRAIVIAEQPKEVLSDS